LLLIIRIKSLISLSDQRPKVEYMLSYWAHEEECDNKLGSSFFFFSSFFHLSFFPFFFLKLKFENL